MSASDAVKTLRKELGKSRRSKVAEGTVVRFVSGGVYTYVAVFAAGKWWLSGTGRWFGGNVFDNDEFIENVLSQADSVEVATAFEEVD